MKNYIEALITRETVRYNDAVLSQKLVNNELENLRKRNQELIHETTAHKDKIDFLKRMLKEETDNA